MTGVAVAPSGDIYAVDGYGRDFIHRFDRSGRYISTFGGGGPPWNFETCHKIAIDGRYTPVRLLCTDRVHDRLVQMDLDGHVLGVLAKGSRWPSALATYHDELAIAEVGGRVTVLGPRGEVLASIGTNDNAQEVKTNLVPPEKWQANTAPAFDGEARISTWILGIAYRRGLTWAGNETRAQTETETVLQDPPTSGESTAQVEMVNLDNALRRLPFEQRTVLHLCYRFAFSCEEIATVMGCPVNAVKAAVLDALRKLRIALCTSGGPMPSGR